MVQTFCKNYITYFSKGALGLVVVVSCILTSGCSRKFGAYTPDLVPAPQPEFAPNVTDEDMKKIRNDFSSKGTPNSGSTSPGSEASEEVKRINAATDFRDIKVKIYPLFKREIPAGDSILPFTSSTFGLENLGGLVVAKKSGEVLLESSQISVNKDLNTIQGKTRSEIQIPSEGIFVIAKDKTTATTIVGMKHKQAGDKFFKYFGSFSLSLEKQLNDSNVTETSLVMMNLIDLETYLLSVVSSEVPSRWATESTKTQEAVKAQAVAARTYALNNIASARNSARRAWDIYPTTQSQAYYGAAMVTRSIVPIITSTEGIILTYDSKVILATFSSNAGGTTCASQHCFSMALPYLISKPDYPGAIDMPGGQCDLLVGLNQLKAAAEEVGKPLPNSPLKDMVVTKELSARPRAVTFQFVNGSEVSLSENETRLLRQKRWQTTSRCGTQLGTFFRLKNVTQDMAQFQRLGFGHGVGMSQWGAYVQAKDGRSAQEILSYYYPNTTLENLNAPAGPLAQGALAKNP